MTIRRCALALFAFAAACTTHVDQYFVAGDDYELARRRDAATGSTTTYRLQHHGSGGEAAVQVATEQVRERPALGLQVAEIDKAAAEQRGVRPYSGLLVKAVRPGSCAAAAGVLAGDVLLSLHGRETVYLPQVAAVEAGLQKDQVVVAKVLRGQEQLDLNVVVELVRDTVTERREVPLEAAHESPRPFAGVTLRGIPAELCAEVFGEPRQAVVVTHVEVGSPAWLAGVRGGDLIEAVDGAPCPPVAELVRSIAERGAREATMQWRVRRGPGEVHEAAVALEDYSGEANLWVPLVVHVEDGVYMDRWSVGPFGLLLSNRNHYLPERRSRTAATRNVFSAVLGLLRVETTPEETEVRLLWFIRFDT